MRAVGAYVLDPSQLTDTALKMAMPLRGGMAGTMSSHCGALTAGILIIGALYGRLEPDGDEELAPAIARRYWQTFLDEFGTSHCTTLREEEPGNEAPTRCGCIMVRSARLLLGVLDEVRLDPPTPREIETWQLDRTGEPCHEKIPPVLPTK